MCRLSISLYKKESQDPETIFYAYPGNIFWAKYPELLFYFFRATNRWQTQKLQKKGSLLPLIFTFQMPLWSLFCICCLVIIHKKYTNKV